MAEFESINESVFKVWKDQDISSLVFDPTLLFKHSGLSEAIFENTSMFEVPLIYENIETLPFKIWKDMDNVSLSFNTEYTTHYLAEDVIKWYIREKDETNGSGNFTLMIPPNILLK